MGVPLPPVEGGASTLQGAGGAHEAQANGEAHQDALLSQHDASMRGLSSLLLPLRAAHASFGLDHAPLSLAAWMRGGAPAPAMRALRAALPATSPPAPTWLEPYDWSSPSPPPLVPASDSESEEDWDEGMPPLAAAAPSSSQGPSLDDLCPWRLVDDAMQEARLTRPRRDGLRQQRPPLRRGGAGRLLLGDGALLSGSFGRRETRLAAPPAPAASSQLPLEAELASMAGRMAQLVRAHQDLLRDANPAVIAGLQDVANQLHSLAAVVAMGPPIGC